MYRIYQRHLIPEVTTFFTSPSSLQRELDPSFFFFSGYETKKISGTEIWDLFSWFLNIFLLLLRPVFPYPKSFFKTKKKRTKDSF